MNTNPNNKIPTCADGLRFFGTQIKLLQFSPLHMLIININMNIYKVHNNGKNDYS